MNVNIGAKIKKRRLELNLTLADLAKISTVSASTIGRIEKGIIIQPTDITIKKLYIGLGIKDDEYNTKNIPATPQAHSTAEVNKAKSKNNKPHSNDEILSEIREIKELLKELVGAWK